MPAFYIFVGILFEADVVSQCEANWNFFNDFGAKISVPYLFRVYFVVHRVKHSRG